ncbi:S-layer family protein, partial [Pleurocapsales cyanobacterium LEGE 06147]|nr:S-layer family protein [Pleurocapsales cyanobacterium LEGE 06147]
ETRQLSVRDGGRVTASTFATGDAGNININASDSVLLTGEGSGLFAQASRTAQGKGGNLTVQTGSLSLSDRAQISAATGFGEGGNITLKAKDNLTLRNNSSISARAFGDADGGNIDIDAGFVIAFPSQAPNDGNDIVASADRGDGGKIDINTQQIFGLQERRAIPGNGTNDIDASSEFGLSGEVVITNLVDDVNQGVVELPDNVVEPEAVTAQACPAAERVAKGESTFTITGRGGLPALATDPLTSDQIRIGGDDTEQSSKKSPRGLVTVTEQPNPPSSEDIVPARGMIVNEKGEIVLTDYPTPNSSQRIPNNSTNCRNS